MIKKPPTKKVLIVFGTRPEAIKMAPLVLKLKQETGIKTEVCITAQHREMLDQVLQLFEIIPDYDLNIMRPNQDLSAITTNILVHLNPVLKTNSHDLIIVHGDTTTTFAASLAAYYHKIPIAHIEAGLRTGDLYSPWPEEANRKLTSSLAKYHFAPTKRAKQNLIKEGINPNNIEVTGNTVIDALFLALRVEIKKQPMRTNKKTVLITGHRRENFGIGFENICKAIKELAEKFPKVEFIYPVHLNPNVQKPVKRILRGKSNILLIEPQSYLNFVHLMNQAYIILTDSGGIQEEAPALGKPVLVMRDTTERPEAIDSGTVVLVGTDKNKIVSECEKLLNNKTIYEKMSYAHNPYGDGKAANRIVEVIKNEF